MFLEKASEFLPQISSTWSSPAGVLYVVAVAVVGTVLAGLTGDVDLYLAQLAQLRAANVGQREAERDLVLAKVVSKILFYYFIIFDQFFFNFSVLNDQFTT